MEPEAPRGGRPSLSPVLITGGAGFIGSNLARRLLAAGERVRVLDDFSAGQRAYLEGVGAEVVEGSISDPAAIRAAVAGASAVVHLAAATSVRESISDPAVGLGVNVAALVGLLQAAVDAKVGSFVFASSNAAAGEAPAGTPVSERQLPRPASPYGASKLAGEAYCSAFATSYGLPTVALRFSNAYGPYSLHKQSVVHLFIRKALAGERLTIHGDGEQTRDFIHVDDICAAIELCLKRPVAGGLFQVGTGEETSILELVRLLSELHGEQLEVSHDGETPGEIRRNFSDVQKARLELGFEASVRFADGLAQTYAWYRDQLAGPLGRAVLAREGD